MSIHVVQLGTPRLPKEGLRIGTVRHPPRGVRKEDFARRDYYDVWLPELSPSAELVTWAFSEPWSARRWATFKRRYLSEMRQPPAQRLIRLLAAISEQMNLSIGCYCEDESCCHRSLLKDLLHEAGARMAEGTSDGTE